MCRAEFVRNGKTYSFDLDCLAGDVMTQLGQAGIMVVKNQNLFGFFIIETGELITNCIGECVEAFCFEVCFDGLRFLENRDMKFGDYTLDAMKRFYGTSDLEEIKELAKNRFFDVDEYFVHDIKAIIQGRIVSYISDSFVAIDHDMVGVKFLDLSIMRTKEWFMEVFVRNWNELEVLNLNGVEVAEEFYSGKFDGGWGAHCPKLKEVWAADWSNRGLSWLRRVVPTDCKVITNRDKCTKSLGELPEILTQLLNEE